MKRLFVTFLLVASTARAADRPDVAELQGMMAVFGMDGWLVTDAGDGANPTAARVVRPDAAPAHRWFYLVPAKGVPTLLAAKDDAAAFAGVPGQKLTYATWQDLDGSLGALLKGRKRVAMEIAHVDAQTVDQVRGHGLEVVSSGELLQLPARWDQDARVSHYVAVHHLVALKTDALAFLRGELAAGRTVTERDLQDRLLLGMSLRGVSSDTSPAVAAGPDTATLDYVAPAQGSRPIAAGDLVTITLRGRAGDDPHAVYAELVWVAYVGDAPPAKMADAFALAVKAQAAVIAALADATKKGKPVRGYEADRVARAMLPAEQMPFATGHSLDTSDPGEGANLDDYQTHDARTILPGEGFTVAPGVVVPGEFGLRAAVDCQLTKTGVEVTTPMQKAIESIPLH